MKNDNHSDNLATNANPEEVLNDIVNMMGEAGEELNLAIDEEVRIVTYSALYP